MDSLAGGSGEFIEERPRGLQNLKHAGDTASDGKKAQGQTVFSAEKILCGVAACRQSTDEPVRGADMQADCGRECGQGHALRRLGEGFQNIQRPVERLYGGVCFCHDFSSFLPALRSMIKTGRYIAAPRL